MKYLWFVLIVLGPVAAQAQYKELGFVGGGRINLHTADFRQLGDFASCCPQFGDASDFALYGGAFFTFPINTTFRFHTQLLLTNESVDFQAFEESFIADLRDTVRVVPAVFQHDLRATLASIRLEPMLAFRAIGTLDLMVGGSLAYTYTRRFVQTETIAEPADFGGYVGEGRQWISHDAEIPNATVLNFSFGIGARYVVELGEGSWFVAPEVQYRLPITGVADDVSWSVSTLRFGVQVGIQLSSSEEEPPSKPTTPAQPVQDTVIAQAPAQPTSQVSVQLDLRSSDPLWQPSDGVLIEETQLVDFIPLLNHVYFNEGEATIPDRYVLKSGQQIDPNNLRESINHVIQIIASRLSNNPDATAEVVGSTSNIESDNALALAEQRASNVRNALVDLGVDSRRITISARKLPENPTVASNPNDKGFADAENRRVEIHLSEPTLLDPFTLTSKSVSFQPPDIIPSVKATSEAGIERIEINAPNAPIANNGVLQTSQLDSSHSSIQFHAIAIDSAGTTGADTAILSVRRVSIEQKRAEKANDVVIERYSLILFGFDDATITSHHERLLARIRQQKDEGASVRIVGMTDSMGSSDYNIALSRRRAIKVAEALGLGAEAIEAAGNNRPRFENRLPEGRAYNRTVLIEVTKSID